MFKKGKSKIAWERYWSCKRLSSYHESVGKWKGAYGERDGTTHSLLDTKVLFWVHLFLMNYICWLASIDEIPVVLLLDKKF